MSSSESLPQLNLFGEMTLFREMQARGIHSSRRVCPCVPEGIERAYPLREEMKCHFCAKVQPTDIEYARFIAWYCFCAPDRIDVHHFAAKYCSEECVVAHNEAIERLEPPWGRVWDVDNLRSFLHVQDFARVLQAVRDRDRATLKTCAYCNAFHCANVPGLCLKDKLKKCSRCERAYYCNERCQRAHWRDHSRVCEKSE